VEGGVSNDQGFSERDYFTKDFLADGSTKTIPFHTSSAFFGLPIKVQKLWQRSLFTSNYRPRNRNKGAFGKQR